VKKRNIELIHIEKNNGEVLLSPYEKKFCLHVKTNDIFLFYQMKEYTPTPSPFHVPASSGAFLQDTVTFPHLYSTILWDPVAGIIDLGT
jgi:hypothetical protein